jgi:hypothetical protein
MLAFFDAVITSARYNLSPMKSNQRQKFIIIWAMLQTNKHIIPYSTGMSA